MDGWKQRSNWKSFAPWWFLETQLKNISQIGDHFPNSLRQKKNHHWNHHLCVWICMKKDVCNIPTIAHPARYAWEKKIGLYIYIYVKTYVMARAGFCQKFFKGAEIHQTSGGRRSLDIEELHDSHAAGYENPMISFNWNSSNYQSAFKTIRRYSFPPPHLYMRSLAVQPIIFSRRSNCATFFFGNQKKTKL